MSPITRVDVERTDTETLTVRWESQQDINVEIGIGPDPTAIDHTHIISVTGDQRQCAIPALQGVRCYVSVSPAGGGGALIAGERIVPFVGVRNFRDLGGYPTPGRGETRWGLVFRADSLHRLTPQDWEAFATLGMRVVYDLRRTEERERLPYELPADTGARVVNIAVRAKHQDDLTPGFMPPEGADRYMLKLYRAMREQSSAEVGRVLCALADPDALPAVFHCMAGKDRTGFVAALLLDLLGVSRPDVLDDYEITASRRNEAMVEYEMGRFADRGIPAELGLALLGAPRWVMATFLEELEAAHGSIEGYVTGPCEVPAGVVDRLRALLVTPPASADLAYGGKLRDSK